MYELKLDMQTACALWVLLEDVVKDFESDNEKTKLTRPDGSEFYVKSDCKTCLDSQDIPILKDMIQQLSKLW